MVMQAEDYSLSEELTRKAGEAYSWLDNQYKRGCLSDNAFFNALIALDMALLGLIPDEYSRWASERRMSLSQVDAGDVRAFYSAQRIVILKLDRQVGLVLMTAIVREPDVRIATKEITNDSADDEYKWACQHFNELAEGLTKRGFTELV